MFMASHRTFQSKMTEREKTFPSLSKRKEGTMKINKRLHQIKRRLERSNKHTILIDFMQLNEKNIS